MRREILKKNVKVIEGIVQAKAIKGREGEICVVVTSFKPSFF